MSRSMIVGLSRGRHAAGRLRRRRAGSRGGLVDKLFGVAGDLHHVLPRLIRRQLAMQLIEQRRRRQAVDVVEGFSLVTGEYARDVMGTRVVGRDDTVVA